MNYIVFDLEWNQPASPEAAVREPVYLAGEIVEIGAVKLNDAFEKVDELRLYIRPQYYTRMHRAIASLTGVHDRDLQEQGLPFPEAFAAFRNWCGEEYTYMTWSTSDLPVLIDNMRLHGLDVSELPDLVDVQRIFDREIMRSQRRTNLDHALEVLGVKGERAHDALNDSRNTVLVCDRMDLDGCIDEYITHPFLDLTAEGQYPDIRTLREDPELLKVDCPWCGSRVSCDGWLQTRREGPVTRGLCECDGEFLMYLNVSETGSGSLRVSRMLYEMSDDLWDQYTALEAELV